MNAVMHKKTHEHGLLMKILELQWQGGVEADARVEAFSDGIAANWNILRLTLRDGHWTVTSDKSDGVS